MSCDLYGRRPRVAQQSARNNRWGLVAFGVIAKQEAKVTDDREKLSTGPNERPINESIAGTGPGVPDDALAPDAELPDAPSDEEDERAARALDAPMSAKSDDTLPLDGE